jgi:hypothetical protein
VIHGTVTDGQGNPIEKARVSVFDIAPSTVFISGGQIGFGELFGHLGHESDAAGRYRIEGVTPGTAHVFAQRMEPRADGVSVAFTNTTLDVAPGTEQAWNPEITDGRGLTRCPKRHFGGQQRSSRTDASLSATYTCCRRGKLLRHP